MFVNSLNWHGKADLGVGPPLVSKLPRRINMDHINRLASPRHCVPKFENSTKQVHTIPRYPNVNTDQTRRDTNSTKSIHTPSTPKRPVLGTKILKPASSDETAIPRPSDRISPSIIETFHQPKPIVASELSLKMGCGDLSAPVGSKKEKSIKSCNMTRIVTLSQPRVIPVNPNAKCNPYKVAKSATKPLSNRRARHIEVLSQVPKRKVHTTIKIKKKIEKI